MREWKESILVKPNMQNLKLWYHSVGNMGYIHFWLIFSKHILLMNQCIIITFFFFLFVSQVVPQKKVVMGHPLRLLIVEQISSLHATWVVFDK